MPKAQKDVTRDDVLVKCEKSWRRISRRGSAVSKYNQWLTKMLIRPEAPKSAASVRRAWAAIAAKVASPIMGKTSCIHEKSPL
jgi:hypothetical protein